MRLPKALTDLFQGAPTPGVLAVFGHLDATLAAIGELKAGGKGDDISVYSPMANHHIEDALDRPVSSVRMYTLIGGIAGCAIGAWLTLYASADWPVQVGGKPIGSIPPYVVIMFEMTVLFGALNTLIGVLLNSLRSAKRQGTIPWDPRFTNDKWGVFVPCAPAESGTVEQLLKRCGAEEVRRA